MALPLASVTSIFQPSPGRSAPSSSRSFSPQAVVASSQAAAWSANSSPSFLKGRASGVSGELMEAWGRYVAITSNVVVLPPSASVPPPEDRRGEELLRP